MMKKLIIAAAFILITGATFGQTLEKGNSLGLHVFTITLDPDVTMNQWLDFFSNKYIPEFERNFEGMKIILLEGDRGRYENKIGIIIYFKTENNRDRYWPEEAKSSDEAKAAVKKLQPLIDELAKLGTWSDEYSGFVVR